MTLGIMELVRRLGRSAAVAVLFAMLMPMVLAALPSNLTAAEAALLRDVEVSRCLPGEENGGRPMDHATHDCCVLCAPAAQVAAPPVHAIYAIASTPHWLSFVLVPSNDETPPPLWPPARRPAPRAPPALQLTIV